MPNEALMTGVQVNAAERLSQLNWGANFRALCRTQPRVARLLADVDLTNLQWLLARDGSLTAMESGRWWTGCSVPVLAGRALLKTLDAHSGNSFMLAPAHAGLVRAAREKVGHCTALFIAQPDAQLARVILACHDFSDQIDRHRFWVVCGEQWAAQLEQLLIDYPGLALPSWFIRSRLTSDEENAPMINEAQRLFSKMLIERGSDLAGIKTEVVVGADPNRILLVGGTEFRLWDFGTRVLERQLAGRVSIQRFDTDDALSGAPVALAKAARTCGAVVSANISRADCNQLVPIDQPWITWLTEPAVPAFATAGPRDALILADARWTSIAQKAGWPAARVRVGAWPAGDGSLFAGVAGPAHSEAARRLEMAIVCDTQKVQIPSTVEDFSTHRLLWELIEEELTANPLAVEDVDVYLADRAGQLNISFETLDRQRFVTQLIVPVYQQSLARLLISAGVPLRLWGRGWSELPEFSGNLGGHLESHMAFESAIARCCALVYCWPKRTAHPIDALGKLVIHRSGGDRAALLLCVQQAMRGPNAKPAAVHGTASLGVTITDLLREAGEFSKTER
jgi:hypothetical protein